MTFFYWFYKRTLSASNAEIEVFAFFTILGFFLLAIVTIISSFVFVVENRTDWKKIIIPILIVGLTIPAINIYGTLYTCLSNQAFVRIINDSDKQINRIWSDDFQMTYFKDKGNDFILSFYPVYTYNWKQEWSPGMFSHTADTLHIDIKQKGDSILTYNLPAFYKGDCKTIKLTEIINGK